MLIFSDLEEDLQKGHIRDFPISLPDIHVVALNVTKLRSDNIDPRDYLERLDLWEQRVYEAGGSWDVINDLERMDRLIAQREPLGEARPGQTQLILLSCPAPAGLFLPVAPICRRVINSLSSPHRRKSVRHQSIFSVLSDLPAFPADRSG